MQGDILQSYFSKTLGPPYSDTPWRQWPQAKGIWLLSSPLHARSLQDLKVRNEHHKLSTPLSHVRKLLHDFFLKVPRENDDVIRAGDFYVFFMTNMYVTS